MTAGEAFQIIGFSCLHHFAANRDAMAQSNPEGVRQKWVGLQRLRAAMSLFKELIEQPDANHIKGELNGSPNSSDRRGTLMRS